MARNDYDQALLDGYRERALALKPAGAVATSRGWEVEGSRGSELLVSFPGLDKLFEEAVVEAVEPVAVAPVVEAVAEPAPEAEKPVEQVVEAVAEKKTRRSKKAEATVE